MLHINNLTLMSLFVSFGDDVILSWLMFVLQSTVREGGCDDAADALRKIIFQN
jgi:hypothetical protein